MNRNERLKFMSEKQKAQRRAQSVCGECLLTDYFLAESTEKPLERSMIDFSTPETPTADDTKLILRVLAKRQVVQCSRVQRGHASSSFSSSISSPLGTYDVRRRARARADNKLRRDVVPVEGPLPLVLWDRRDVVFCFL